jgi:superfamily I DNA/RNA helicase
MAITRLPAEPFVAIGCIFAGVLGGVLALSSIARYREEEKNLRRSFYKDRDKVHLSTVDCAQGQTFDNVVLVVTHNDTGNIEELFSGMTRARKTLRIVDASPNQWAYKMLKQYNSYEVKVVEDVSEKTFQRFNVDDIPF